VSRRAALVGARVVEEDRSEARQGFSVVSSALHLSLAVVVRLPPFSFPDRRQDRIVIVRARTKAPMTDDLSCPTYARCITMATSLHIVTSNMNTRTGLWSLRSISYIPFLSIRTLFPVQAHLSDGLPLSLCEGRKSGKDCLNSLFFPYLALYTYIPSSTITAPVF